MSASTSTASPSTPSSLLSFLQNSSLHTTLIDTIVALQSSDVPKTQTRISELFRQVKQDSQLKNFTAGGYKQEGKSPSSASSDSCVIGEKIFSSPQTEQQLTQLKQILDLLRTAQEKEATTERRSRKSNAQKANQLQTFTNITDDSTYWNLLGIQLHDAPLLQKSLSLFQIKHPQLKHIRFVGKFFGLEGNYFVIETDHDGEDKLSADEEEAFKEDASSQNRRRYRVRFGTTEQPAEQPAERGTTNHYRYWVCRSGEDLTRSNWLRLPDVTPAQILTAQRIKKYLTGRLNATVDSYPQFPGVEANYLRAQVSRIVAATTIAPKGLYKLWAPPEDEDEDEDAPKKEIVPPVSDLVLTSTAAGGEEEEEDEEGDALNVKTLQKPENWVHLAPLILDVGRATEYKPPKIKTGDEDEDEEEEEDEEDTNKVPRLRELNADEGLQLPDYLKPLEKPKKTGDEEEEEEEEADDEEEGEGGGLKKGQYASWNFESFGELDESSALVLARSLRWPGAFAYAAHKGKKAGTIYIGDGLKAAGDLNVFTPLIPQPIQQDDAEPKQQEDPTVSNEKRVRDLGEEPLRDEEEGEGEGEEDED